MLKHVLLALCVAAAVSAKGLKPGAKKGTFLFDMQEGLMEMASEQFTSSGSIQMPLAVGVNMAETDFCKITSDSEFNRESKSMFFGQTCKDAFVELYDEEDQCGGVFCNAVRMFKNEGYEIIVEVIEAGSDAEAFATMKERIVKPAMETMCRCSMPLLDAWMDCKSGMGEAQIFDMLQISGGFDTNADYLQGETFKDFWVEMLVNRTNWDNIYTMVERIVDNMCQEDTQFGGKCYDYYWTAATNVYQWFLKSTGYEPSPCKAKGKRCGVEPLSASYEDSCSTFDLEEFGSAVSFSDVQDKVADAFCVEDCSGLYQDVLLGCCSASMIQDTDLSDSVVAVASDFNELFEEFYVEEEEESEYEWEDMGGMEDMNFWTDETPEEEEITFTTVLGYFNDSLAMLRNPTCDNGVEYSVVSCADYDGEGSSNMDEEDEIPEECAGLTKKDLKKCMREYEEAMEEEEEEEEMEIPEECADLTKKALKKCIREYEEAMEEEEEDGEEMEDEEDPCEGLSGKQLKKCEKKGNKDKKKDKKNKKNKDQEA